jgi:hypothetical protein
VVAFDMQKANKKPEPAISRSKDFKKASLREGGGYVIIRSATLVKNRDKTIE